MGSDRERLHRRDEHQKLSDEERRREQQRRLLDERYDEVLDEEPGKRTAVDPAIPDAASSGLDAQTAFGRQPWQHRGATFEDFRVAGLRELCDAVPDRVLRRATLAAAEPVIASRLAPPRSARPNADGRALSRAADRRAATLYRHAQDASEVPTEDPIVEEALQRCGSGTALPAALRKELERELGIPLGRVRVHTDGVAAAATRAVRANAFTVGEDIFFAAGAFAPETPEGRRLLAHELAHVVQAYQGRTARADRGIHISTPDESLEREADATADRIAKTPAQRRAQLQAPVGALPAPLRQQMEDAFGVDFSTVTVREDASASEVGARAYTRGEEVVFAPGAFDPHSASGRTVIGHELAHVVQQRAGRVTADEPGGERNANRGLEAEADALGARAAAGERVHAPSAAKTASSSPSRVRQHWDDPPRMVPVTVIPRERPTPAGREMQAALAQAIPADRRHDDGLVLFNILPALATILDPSVTAERSDLILGRTSPWNPASYEADNIPTPYVYALWDYYKARWESSNRAERRTHIDAARDHWRSLFNWPHQRDFIVAAQRPRIQQLVERLIDRPVQHLRSDRTFDVLSHNGTPLTAEERAARVRAAETATTTRRSGGGGGRSSGRSETIDVAPGEVHVTDGEAHTVRYVNPAMIRFVPHVTSVSPDPRRAAFDPLAAILRERMHTTDPTALAAIDARLPEAEAQAKERVRVYVRAHRHGAELAEALTAIETLPATVDVAVQTHDVDVGLFRVHLEPVEPGALVERPGGFRATTTEISTGRSVTGRASDDVMTRVLEGLSGERLRIARQYLEVIRRAEGSLTSLNTWDRLRITLGSGVGAAGVLQNDFAEFEASDPVAYERIFGRHDIHTDSRVARGRRHSTFRTTGASGETLTGDAATEEMANDPATLGVMVAAGFDPSWQAFLLRGGRTSIDRAFAVGFTVETGVTLAEGGTTNLLDWFTGQVPPEVTSRALFSLADDFHGGGHLAAETVSGFGPHYQTAAEANHFEAAQPASAPGAARIDIATWLGNERDHPRRRRHIDAVLAAPADATAAPSAAPPTP